MDPEGGSQKATLVVLLVVGQLSVRQWPAVTTVARTPFRVHSTFRTFFYFLVRFLFGLSYKIRCFGTGRPCAYMTVREGMSDVSRDVLAAWTRDLQQCDPMFN